LGYAIQEAAWQFRVKPPRVDGEYQVGTWVQIRIDITPGQ
jgi:protein TonB